MMTLQQQMMKAMARAIVARGEAKSPYGLFLSAQTFLECVAHYELPENVLSWGTAPHKEWFLENIIKHADKLPEICTDTDKCP